MIFRRPAALGALAAFLFAAPVAEAASVVVDQIGYLAPRLTDGGALELGADHGTYLDNGANWAPLETLVVHVPDRAKHALSAHASYSFIGPAGSDAWSTAKTPALAASGSLPGLGWSTDQMFGRILTSPRPTITLRAAQGPGKVFAYLTNVANTQAGTHIFDLDAGPTTFSSGVNNNRVTLFVWTFTAPGYYCLDLEATARPVSGGMVSDRRALAVAVGAVDPATAPPCTPDFSATAVALAVAPARQQQAGEPVTLTATTTPSGAAGTVQFYDGTTALGSPVPVEGGVARLTTNELPVGQHTISATFTPENPVTYEQSSSAPLNYGVYDPRAYVFGAAQHADVAVRVNSDGLELGLRKSDLAGGGNVSWHAFDDSVVSLPDAARLTLPDDPRFAFLGRPGDPTWRVPLTHNPALLWLGYSGEALDRDAVRGTVALTLDAVSGPAGAPAPGDVIAWNGNVPDNGAKPVFSTRRGLPDGAPLPRTHQHANWDFTAPGTYCVTLTARGVLANGTRSHSTETLTVVVGDANPYLTSTCGRLGAVPARTHALTPVDATGDHTARVVRSPFAHLEPHLRDGALTVALLEGQQAGPGVRRDLADLVFAADTQTTITTNPDRVPWAGAPGDAGWEISENSRRSTLGSSTLGLDGADVRDDVRWSLVRAEGPGDVIVHDGTGYETGTALLSTRTGHPVTTQPLELGRISDATWLFKAPGVYCVTLRWDATRADGTPVSDQQTLTFVAGTRDPATVTPCGHGGAADPPSGPVGDPDTPEPGTPSGRTVLGIGHVDVFATLAAGALTLSLKDSTGDGEIVHRALSDTVLHVTPGARTTVPDADAYHFLGAPGSAVWLLPLTADPSLLWPGWSLSSDGSVAGGDRVRWTLDRVRGPGRFTLYTAGVWAEPIVLFDSADGLPDALEFDSHAHGNWAFTHEGIYCLDVTMSATANPTVRDSGTLLVAVGAVDAVAATEADCEPLPDPAPTPAAAPASDRRDSGNAAATRLGPPTIRLSSSHARLRTALTRRALTTTCRLNTPGTCKVRASLSAATARRVGFKGRTLNTGRASANGNVRIKLGPKGLRALRRAGRTITIQLTATATAPGRPHANHHATLTLRK